MDFAGKARRVMPDANSIDRKFCPLCGEKESRFLLEKEGGTYVKCRRCKMVYTDPAPSPDELKRIADEWAEKHHAGEHRAKWEGNTALRELVYGPRMWRIDQYRYFNRLLDVGCSTGEFLDYAKGRGWEVAGCELAGHTARIARERVGCEVKSVSFEEAEFEEGSFDVVTMWDVIEHLFDPDAALSEAWRVLRPGGLLVLNTPNYNSLSRLLLGKKWEAIYPPRHLFVFCPSTARRLVALSGGKVVALQAVDLNPLDIIAGTFRRKSYGFDARQRNIGSVKEMMLRYRSLAAIRTGVNTFLNITRLGDVLEVYAERAP